MKAEDFKELDKRMTEKIKKEFREEEIEHECYMCHGDGCLTNDASTWTCEECSGSGVIVIKH